MSSAVGDGDFGGGGSDPASDLGDLGGNFGFGGSPVSDVTSLGDLGGNFGLGPTSASPASSDIADQGISFDVNNAVTVNGFANIATTFSPTLGGITSVPVAFGFEPTQSFATPDSFAGIFSTPATAPTAAPASTIGQTLTALGSVVLGVLGIASGTPQGVIGGAMSVGNNFGNVASSFGNIASLGGADSSVTGGSAAAGGPSNDGFSAVQFSPLAGQSAATAGTATSAGLGGLAAALAGSLAGGLQPRQTGRYAQPQTATNTATKNPLLLLLALGAGAYLLTA